MDPGSTEEYQARLKTRNEALERCRRLDRLVANLRLTAAIVFFAVAWLAWGMGAVSGWWMLVPLAAYVALVIYHERVYRMGRRANRSVAFYGRGPGRIEDRRAGTGNPRTHVVDEPPPHP